MTKPELLARLHEFLSGYQDDINKANAALDHVDGEVESFYDGRLSILPELCDRIAGLIADLEREGVTPI